jgi:hypothetical protein
MQELRATEGTPRAEALAKFKPRNSAENWKAHGPAIAELALAADFTSIDTDKAIAGAMNSYWAWASVRGLDMSAESLLTTERIDAYLATVESESKGTIGWRLNKVARAFLKTAPAERHARKPLSAPHTARERESFIEAAATMPTRTERDEETARNVIYLVNAAFGAGMDRSAVHQVRCGWFRDSSNGLWLKHPDIDVQIPIARGYAERLRPTLNGDKDAYVLRPGYAADRADQASKVLERARNLQPALADFDISRAARRWRVDLLDAVNFDVVAALCEVRPGQKSLADLVPYLRTRSPQDASRLAGGWLL